MQQDAHSLRQDLYGVVHYYAELSQLARKGEVDPISQIGRILEKRIPYLLLIIGDLLPLLESDRMTYHEVLFTIIRAAQQFPDQKVLAQSRSEIEKIESEGRIFLYAVKWMEAENNLRPLARDVAKMRKTLAELNRKYRERYVADDVDTTTLIPYFLERDESESDEISLTRTADLVRRAILELHRLMIEQESSRSLFGFFKGSRKEMAQELMKLVWFLFRCGFSVDRVSSGYHKDLLSDFLNERLLDYLRQTTDSIQTLAGLSHHLALISLIDFGGFFELPSDYCDLEDPAEVARCVKLIRSRKRRGWSLLGKTSQLHLIYGSRPEGRLAQSFLEYRYYAAFGDYHGEHRLRDPRGDRAIEVYRPIVNRAAMERRTNEDLKESGRYFSSKTREEMAGIIKLILDSLENPAKVKGGKIKILGDISSGAMGKVSIGIFRGRIVALKTVKSQIARDFGDPEALLEYEAAMHARVQTPEQHPYIVEYYGLMEQGGEKLLINAYHPNDSLTQLVEKNWTRRYKPPLAVESYLNLATLEVIINQLLQCLRLFREKNVVHRDLKTDNVLYMVDKNEMVNQLKVIDFGVALSVGAGAVEDLFKGKVVGTFSYMAPEQVRGKSVFQSDLYSVGAIITVLITGKLPMVFPRAAHRQELAAQIMRVEKEPRPKLTALNPWLTRNTALEYLAATVERMLDLDPLSRPTLEEVQQAFEGLFQHLGEEKHLTSVFYHRG